jgi:hypothetical protein
MLSGKHDRFARAGEWGGGGGADNYVHATLLYLLKNLWEQKGAFALCGQFFDKNTASPLLTVCYICRICFNHNRM